MIIRDIQLAEIEGKLCSCNYICAIYYSEFFVCRVVQNKKHHLRKSAKLFKSLCTFRIAITYTKQHQNRYRSQPNFQTRPYKKQSCSGIRNYIILRITRKLSVCVHQANVDRNYFPRLHKRFPHSLCEGKVLRSTQRKISTFDTLQGGPIRPILKKLLLSSIQIQRISPFLSILNRLTQQILISYKFQKGTYILGTLLSLGTKS